MAFAPELRFVRGQQPPVSGIRYVDLDDVLEHNMFVEGVTRTGKTNLVRDLIESVFGQVPMIIIDPEGEYPSLRSDERPFLIVGRGRDVDVEPTRDAVLELMGDIISNGVSAIFDLFNYEDEKPDNATPSEVTTIVNAICEALYGLPEDHPGSILAIFDELQDLAPEHGGRLTSTPYARRVAKRGLKRGVSMIGISQRVGDVSNGVLTQLKSKVIGGTDNKDIPNALDELGLARKDRNVIADLPQGEFWVKGPAFSRHAMHVRSRLAQTSPPKRRRGEGVATTKPAPAAIAALAERIAARQVQRQVEKEAEASELEELRARVAELESDHEAGDDVVAPRPDPAAIAAARAEGAADMCARFQRKLGVLRPFVSGGRDQLIATLADIQEVASMLDGMVDTLTDECDDAGAAVHAKPRPVNAPAVVVPTAEALASLPATERRILDHLVGLAGAASHRRAIGEALDLNLLAGGRTGGHIKHLVALGLAEIPRRGWLRASSVALSGGTL